jgi:hypothetical protein
LIQELTPMLEACARLLEGHGMSCIGSIVYT